MMIPYVLLRTFTLIIVGINTFCQSNVVINLRIYNYENSDDIGYNGRKCENFHMFKDWCDPMFHVCVSSRYKCDIVSDSIEHWKNKKYVYHVHSKKIKLDSFIRSIKVEVKVDDHDRFDGHDHIARFNSNFYVSRLDFNYRTQMTVSPRGLNIHLSASIVMTCDLNYYGKECETYCVAKINNYNCNRVTGEKICKLNCGRFGRCLLDNVGNEFSCECSNGWSGENCRSIHFTDCSKLSCKGRCIETRSMKHCACQHSSYFEKCSENIKRTTKKIPTTIPFTKEILFENDIKLKKTEFFYKSPNSSTFRKTVPPKMGTTRISVPNKTSKEMPTTRTTASESINCAQLKELCINRYVQKLCNKTCGTSTSHTLSRTESSNTPRYFITTTSTPTAHSSASSRSSAIQSNIQQHQMAPQHQIPYFSSTIIIICLLLILCTCVIMLTIVIGRKKKKGSSVKNRSHQMPHSQRPLPPIIDRALIHSDVWTVLNQNRQNCIPSCEYDLCTLGKSCNRGTLLLQGNPKGHNEEFDPYEEPMIGNFDSFTCETDFMSSEDNVSAEYEVPNKPVQ